jgi:hypothetical protein
MATLEVAMKKHNINIDSCCCSSSHGHALSASGFSFNTPSTTISSSDEWLIDSGASYHMAKDKAIFSTLNECSTRRCNLPIQQRIFNPMKRRHQL